MLTDTTLVELRELVSTAAPAARREELVGALDDLQRTIAAQAVVVRNLTAELRNRRIGDAAMDAVLPPDLLDSVLGRLGEPKRTAFSLAEAQGACAALVDESARATEIADIAAGVARVVRVFL